MSDQLRPAEAKEVLGQARISALYYHPLKSGRRVYTDWAELGEGGIVHDRELMAVDPATGVFVSQRTDPLLALVDTHIDDGRIRMSVGSSTVEEDIIPDGDIRLVSVHSDRGLAGIDQHPHLSELVSDTLGRSVVIVRQAPQHPRYIDTEYMVYSPHAPNQVWWGDGFSFLLVTSESVAQLNADIQKDTPGHPDVPIDSFRANIETRGFRGAYKEDSVLTVLIGTTLFHFVKPCSRCDITTTDQMTGERNPQASNYNSALRGRQPLTTLLRTRMIEFVPGKPRPMFGWNLAHEMYEERSIIHVGDPLEVIDLR